jgi:hypothetical protein
MSEPFMEVCTVYYLIYALLFVIRIHLRKQCLAMLPVCTGTNTLPRGGCRRHQPLHLHVPVPVPIPAMKTKRSLASDVRERLSVC